MSRPDGESAKDGAVATPAHSVKTTRIDPTNFTEQHYPTQRESGNRHFTPEKQTKRRLPNSTPVIHPPSSKATDPRPLPGSREGGWGRKIAENRKRGHPFG